MNRKELIRNLRNIEEEIIYELNRLGFNSIYDKEKNRNTNFMFGIINDRFNQGFYDYKTKTIKEKINLKNSDSIIRILDNDHLSYRISALTNIKFKLKRLKNNYISDKKELICDYAYYEGINQRKTFIENEGIKPFTSLKKLSPNDSLKLYIYNKYSLLDNYTKEELLDGIISISKILMNMLPEKYSFNKAYGNALGELNKGMYGLNSARIKDNFRNNNIKIPKDNILYLMNEEHLKYRLISLHIINNYSNMYNKDEYDLFIDKCKLTGILSKELFIEQNNEKPYYNLFNINKSSTKISKNALKGQYKLQNSSSKMVCYEQSSLFDPPKKRVKDLQIDKE